jgi:hypothetical protein
MAARRDDLRRVALNRCAFVLGTSTLPFIWNVFRSYRCGRVVTVDDPWGFGNSLEWATSCPPPRHNFAELPAYVPSAPPSSCATPTSWTASGKRRTSAGNRSSAVPETWRRNTRSQTSRAPGTRPTGPVRAKTCAQPDANAEPLRSTSAAGSSLHRRPLADAHGAPTMVRRKPAPETLAGGSSRVGRRASRRAGSARVADSAAGCFAESRAHFDVGDGGRAGRLYRLGAAPPGAI